MKKSQLRQIIKEEIKSTLKQKNTISENFIGLGAIKDMIGTEEKRLKEVINSLVQVYNTIIVGYDLRPQDQEGLRSEILKIIGEKLSQNPLK